MCKFSKKCTLHSPSSGGYVNSNVREEAGKELAKAGEGQREFLSLG